MAIIGSASTRFSACPRETSSVFSGENRSNSPHTSSRVFTLKKPVFTIFFSTSPRHASESFGGRPALPLRGRKAWQIYSPTGAFSRNDKRKSYITAGKGKQQFSGKLKRGQAYLALPPILSQSVHSTHKPSSLRQPSQCIRRHTLHSWTARTSSFSDGSPQATQAKSSAIITPPLARHLGTAQIRHAFH